MPTGARRSTRGTCARESSSRRSPAWRLTGGYLQREQGRVYRFLLEMIDLTTGAQHEVLALGNQSMPVAPP
jgi:hypothetical protein